MRIVFWYSEKSRERLLASAFADGARIHGDECILVSTDKPLPDCDVVCMVGVKSKDKFTTCFRQGISVVYFDKGYLRHRGATATWEYWRVAVNAHHPTRYISTVRHPCDRMEKMRMHLCPWRKSGTHIILAGSSAKYHEFYGLYDPTRFACKLVKEIIRRSERTIVYRPKPTWKEAVPIPGTVFSGSSQSLTQALSKAYALVTHGSNACFEAILSGVPCIVLGDAVAKPLSSTNIEQIETPKLATMNERIQWLSNLAYCQWTLREFASGEAWETIRPQLYG